MQDEAPVITRVEALVLLRDACPSFAAMRPSLDKVVEVVQVVEVGQVDASGFGAMAEVSALAHHLVDLAETGDAGEFPAVFGVVEQLLANGDDQTIRLLRTCLIEDLQNITSHRDVRVASRDFRDLLGDESSEVWDELDESWAAAVTAGGSEELRPVASEFLDLGPTDRRTFQSESRELADGTLARPSDVLRYEASQYGDALDHRGEMRRRRPLILLAVFAVCVSLLIIALS